MLAIVVAGSQKIEDCCYTVRTLPHTITLATYRRCNAKISQELSYSARRLGHLPSREKDGQMELWWQYVESYLAPFPRYRGVLVIFHLWQGGCLSLMHSFGTNSGISPRTIYYQKLESLRYIYVTNSMGRSTDSSAWSAPKLTVFREKPPTNGNSRP